MKKLLLPLLVSLILTSSFSNAEITSYDERFTLLCEIESSTGFKWSNGNWHQTRFYAGEKYVIKKLDDVISQLDEDWFHGVNYPYEFCSVHQEGESDWGDSVWRDGCYMVRELEHKEVGIEYSNCRELWLRDDQGSVKLDELSCPNSLPPLTLKPNGLIHIQNAGSLEANPTYIIDGVPTEQKDSWYIAFGRCSQL